MESLIRGLSIHTTQYGFSLLSLKLLYRNGLKIWPNKLRSTWMASPKKNQKNVLPRISDDIPAWSFLRGDHFSDSTWSHLNLKDPLPFRVIAALTKNPKTQHWPCTAKAAKKTISPNPYLEGSLLQGKVGRVLQSQNPTAFGAVTEPYSFWGRPNLKNTTSTTAKAAKKNHNPEPIPGRIPASREIGGQTSVTGPYSFWGRPNLRKTQKTQHRPLPKRQKKTTTLNPYLAGFLLQEKLGGKLQLQDPTAFEVVQTFAKPKKHKVDHCQSGKKEPQPWTHTWKDSCFKRNWGANFSYRTLQLLRLSKPSQNPKNITWTTAEEAKKNHNPEPILGRIPASSLVRGASSTWLPKSLAFEVIQAFLQKKEKHDRLKRSQKKHQKEPFSSHQFEVIFRRPFPYPALPPRTRSTGAGTLPKGMKNYSEVRIL